MNQGIIMLAAGAAMIAYLARSAGQKKAAKKKADEVPTPTPTPAPAPEPAPEPIPPPVPPDVPGGEPPKGDHIGGGGAYVWPHQDIFPTEQAIWDQLLVLGYPLIYPYPFMATVAQFQSDWNKVSKEYFPGQYPEVPVDGLMGNATVTALAHTTEAASLKPNFDYIIAPLWQLFSDELIEKLGQEGATVEAVWWESVGFAEDALRGSGNYVGGTKGFQWPMQDTWQTEGDLWSSLTFLGYDIGGTKWPHAAAVQQFQIDYNKILPAFNAANPQEALTSVTPDGKLGTMSVLALFNTYDRLLTYAQQKTGTLDATQAWQTAVK